MPARIPNPPTSKNRENRLVAGKSSWINHPLKPTFLTVLSTTGNVTYACEIVGVSKVAAYAWRKNDPQFRSAWADALESAGDRLELEARKRAMEGWDEPVYYQGEVVGTVRRHSDGLLMFLLKGAKPEKYRERMEHRVTKVEFEIALPEQLEAPTVDIEPLPDPQE